jgi:hypothetical protein
MDEERAEELMHEAERGVKSRWRMYQQMAAMHYNGDKENLAN